MSPAQPDNPQPAGAFSPSPSPVSTPAAVPLPSLKPGEVITWVKLDRPRLPLGEIIVGSFALVGVLVVGAVAVGLLLGQWRSKRTNTHGAGGLGLR